VNGRYKQSQKVDPGFFDLAATVMNGSRSDEEIEIMLSSMLSIFRTHSTWRASLSHPLPSPSLSKDLSPLPTLLTSHGAEWRIITLDEFGTLCLSLYRYFRTVDWCLTKSLLKEKHSTKIEDIWKETRDLVWKRIDEVATCLRAIGEVRLPLSHEMWRKVT
jgi:hypothetical protein